MVSRGTLYGVLVVLVAGLVASSSLTAYYFYEFNHEVAVNSQLQSLLSKYGATIASDVLIDYGNGTQTWFNYTQARPGWNLYTLTEAVTNGDVNATCCEFGSHFVVGIGGLQNVPSEDRAWFSWTYNSSSSWRPAQVGVDQTDVVNGSVFAWTYCQYDPNTGSPKCSVGAP